MDVAVVSVVSSGLVAVGSLALQWRNGAEQRRHDATQAFEARAWELKAPGHLDLLATLGQIRDRADDGYLVATGERKWLEDVYTAQSVVLAYGTDECRHDLDTLIEFLGTLSDRSLDADHAVQEALAAKKRLMDALHDPGVAVPIAPLFEARYAAEDRVRRTYTYDSVKLRGLTDKLIASTRSSLRGGL